MVYGDTLTSALGSGSCMLLVGMVAPALQAQPLTLSRLDADPPAARVIAGDHDAQFTEAALPRIVEREPGVRWWRVDRAMRRSPPTATPQLVLSVAAIERGRILGAGRGVAIAACADGEGRRPRSFHPCAGGALAPRPGGGRGGLRARRRCAAARRCRWRSSRWRKCIATTCGTSRGAARSSSRCWCWRSCRSASGSASASAATPTCWSRCWRRCCTCSVSAAKCGHCRGWPTAIGGDVRTSRLFGVMSVIASHQLHRVLPRPAQAPATVHARRAWLQCRDGAVVAGEPGVGCGRSSRVLANIVLLVAAVTVLVASVIGTWRGQRAAYFLLVSLAADDRAAGVAHRRAPRLLGQPGHGWCYAFPAGFAFAGLVLTVGLADSMQQLRRDRDQASRLATFDALTGAMSRPATDERLGAAVADAHRSGLPLSLVFFDVDHFKRINDEFGHRAGDECLRIIASRTRNRLRRYDQFGRYGGDEMLVILPDTHLVEARGVAGKPALVDQLPAAVDRRSPAQRHAQPGHRPTAAGGDRRTPARTRRRRALLQQGRRPRPCIGPRARHVTQEISALQLGTRRAASDSAGTRRVSGRVIRFDVDPGRQACTARGRWCAQSLAAGLWLARTLLGQRWCVVRAVPPPRLFPAAAAGRSARRTSSCPSAGAGRWRGRWRRPRR